MIQVSVIIPNYNHASFLKERIESVLNQTYTGFELILLDDCSTDNSRDIIEQYRQHPRLSHIVYNKCNSGFPSRQWQKGVQLAKGEWIWIAESDDVAEPVFLETLIGYIQQYPAANLVYSNSYKEDSDTANHFKTTADESNFDFSTKNWDGSQLLKGETAIKNYLCKKNIILNASSALMYKKQVKKFIQKTSVIKYYADWYLYICLAAGSGIGYCSQPLNTFRRHAGSLILNSKLYGIKTDCFRILNLLLKQPCVTDKPGTIHYFADNYFRPGLKKDGMINFIRLLFRFLFINPRLAIVICRKIIGSANKGQAG